MPTLQDASSNVRVAQGPVEAKLAPGLIYTEGLASRPESDDDGLHVRVFPRQKEVMENSDAFRTENNLQSQLSQSELKYSHSTKMTKHQAERTGDPFSESKVYFN